jgi:acetolactate synthase I/II/III large subunit
MRLTGGEILAEYLIAERCPFVCGIPGHGDMGIFDAFKDRGERIGVVAPRHEQSAVHIADAHYRAGGGMLATITSIGPGSANTVMGLATAYVDSIPVLAVSGGPQTYMYGRGVLQELERQHDGDFPSVVRPVVKRSFTAFRPDHVADYVARAFNVALTGRPGPVHIEMPMDVQAEAVDVDVPVPAQRRPAGAIHGDPREIARAAALLAAAKRPVILAGGGCVQAGADAELRALAERLSAAVLATMTSKGVFPEDHPLSGEHTGANGTLCGNHLSRTADVILAVGTRFAEQTCSSYVPGQSFSIPPTRLIHIDIDPYEIGKNYPTEVGIVADARTGLADLLAAVDEHHRGADPDRASYRAEIAAHKAQWRDAIRARWVDGHLSMSRVLAAIRDATPRETIVIASAGHPQIQTFQEFPSYEPRTALSPGGYSTMGFSLPAAIGAKLAQPDRPVIALAGDGDTLMTVQELALAAELNIPIILACLNNSGWVSIRDFQRGMFGESRAFSVEFRRRRGDQLMPVDFVQVAKGLNCDGVAVHEPSEIAPAVGRGLASDGPFVIDFRLAREPRDTEGINAGHWDLPKPSYLA